MRYVRRILVVLGGVSAMFGLMQLVPYGRTRTNPPTIQEPRWDTPATRDLVVRACFDCHSNETKWPWYSHVAPVSWVIQRRVDIGRSVVNFSEWTRRYDLADQAPSSVIRRDMPPRSYRWFHPHAQLTHDEKVQLARGLANTLHLEWRE
jgi:hypothetical protein